MGARDAAGHVWLRAGWGVVSPGDGCTHSYLAAYPATVKSNFSAVATGGLTTGHSFLVCYADFAEAQRISETRRG